MAVAALLQQIKAAHNESEKNQLKADLKVELSKLKSLKSNDHPQLGGLFEDAADLENLGEALASNISITEIELNGAYMTPEFNRFLNKIQENTTITSLYLMSWTIEESNAKALAHMLAHGKLKTLRICCDIGKPMAPSPFSILTEAVSKNTTVTDLTLRWFPGDELLKKLTQIISSNHTLLTVSANGPASPTPENREKLAQAIEKSKLNGFYWPDMDKEAGYKNWTKQISDKLYAKKEAARAAREAEETASFKAEWAAKRAAEEAAQEAEKIATIEREFTEINADMDFIQIEKKLFPLLEVMGENPNDRQKTILRDGLKKLNTLHFCSLTKTLFNPFPSVIKLTPASIKHVFEALEKNDTITELTLEHLNIGKDELSALSKILLNNKKIKRISLNYNQIDIESLDILIQIIKNNPDLSLSFNNNPLLQNSTAVVDHFKNNHTVLNQHAIDTIVHVFKQADRDAIETVLKGNIILHRVSEITADMDAEEKTKRLLTLLKSMGEHPSDRQKIALKAAVNQFSNLRLSHQQLTDIHIANLSEALLTNTTVTDLDFFDNNITEKGVESLSKILLTNKVIKNLKLALNNIGSGSIHSFVAVLKNNKTLAYLNLDINPLGQDTLRLVKALKNNAIINELSLQRVGLTINTQAALIFLENLKNNKTLRHLSLLNSFGFNSTPNSIDNDSIALFLALLENNQTLLQLFLPNEHRLDYDTEFRMKFYLERNLKLAKETFAKAQASASGEALGLHLPPDVAILVNDYLELPLDSFKEGISAGENKARAQKAANKAEEAANRALVAAQNANTATQNATNALETTHKARNKAQSDQLAQATQAIEESKRLLKENEDLKKHKQNQNIEILKSLQESDEVLKNHEQLIKAPDLVPTVPSSFNSKKALERTSIGAIILGVIAAAVLFAVATPLIAGIVLGVFAIGAGITFTASRKKPKTHHNQSALTPKQASSEPSKIIDTVDRANTPEVTTELPMGLQSSAEPDNRSAPKVKK